MKANKRKEIAEFVSQYMDKNPDATARIVIKQIKAELGYSVTNSFMSNLYKDYHIPTREQRCNEQVRLYCENNTPLARGLKDYLEEVGFKRSRDTCYRKVRQWQESKKKKNSRENLFLKKYPFRSRDQVKDLIILRDAIVEAVNRNPSFDDDAITAYLRAKGINRSVSAVSRQRKALCIRSLSSRTMQREIEYFSTTHRMDQSYHGLMRFMYKQGFPGYTKAQAYEALKMRDEREEQDVRQAA